jgi:hypothetical protein
MNQKQFLTLVILGVLVGGLGLYLYNKQKQSYAPSSFQTGAKVIKDFRSMTLRICESSRAPTRSTSFVPRLGA